MSNGVMANINQMIEFLILRPLSLLNLVLKLFRNKRSTRPKWKEEGEIPLWRKVDYE